MMKPMTVLLAAVAAMLCGCAVTPQKRLPRQTGESLVFVGTEPAHLAWPAKGKLSVRNTYRRQTDTIDYIERRDYEVDRTDGSLRRTEGSRIPDFRKNMLFGQEAFDHSKFPGFGNNGYFAFVDYTLATPSKWPVQPSQAELLKATRAKLQAGKEVKIVAFGDSITAGGDATQPELIFWRRWSDALQAKYPAARVTPINGATGGDSTVQGLQRLETKVLQQKPDLVLIGFGMNDHNVNGVPIPQFEANLKRMIDSIRTQTAAEVVLFSAFPPNPKWKFGSHRMELYAAATEQVARETGCAFADVFNNWQTLATRKKPEDLLGNNINHPNDFGHWIYFSVLQAMDL